MNPRVAARLYAGAVDATAMTRFEMYPIAFRFRPLWPGRLASSGAGWPTGIVALSIGTPLLVGTLALPRSRTVR
jgi:hypothetical protein